MKKSFLSVNERRTVITALDARVKLVVLFMTSIGVITIENPATLGIMFATAGLLHLTARTEARKLKILFIALAVGLWGTVFGQAIFYAGFPRTAIVTIISSENSFVGQLIGGLYIYKEGFTHGLMQGMRFLTMTTLGMLVVWTTEPQEMLRGLLRMRIPYLQAFMLITALRFIPIMIAEVESILMALRIKKFRALKSGVTRPIRSATYMLNPLLSNLVRKSGFLALSVQCRGFTPGASAGAIDRKPLSFPEILVIFASAAMILNVILLKILYVLYFHGAYYASHLRPLYWLTKTYL